MRSGALTLRLPAEVVEVVDGDTVLVIVKGGNNPFKIRFHGIDAPKLDQQYGQKSKDKLAALLAGKDIFVDILCVDRYRRQVGSCIGGTRTSPSTKSLSNVGSPITSPNMECSGVGIWARFGGEIRPWSHRHGGTQTPIEYKKEREAAKEK